MTTEKQGALDAATDLSTARERVMLERLYDMAREFFKDPKNQQASRAWQKNKEELHNGTNHINP